MERQDCADAQHADDQRVQPRIGEEGLKDLALQHERDEHAQNDEHQHPDKEDAGRGELCLVDLGGRHRFGL